MKLHWSLLLVITFLPSILCASSSDHTFKHSKPNDDSLLDEVKIECFVGEECVGFISCVKIPLLNDYVLHTFYVYPEYRNKGYGTHLLTHACDYLQSIHARNIYIQPGPFELNQDGCLDNAMDDRPLRLQRLITLYKKNQFVRAEEWLLPFIRLLYTCMDIQEEANHLMVHHIQQAD